MLIVIDNEIITLSYIVKNKEKNTLVKNNFCRLEINGANK